VHRWWPAWSSGGALPSIPRAMLTGQIGGVYAVACAELHGRPVAMTSGFDRTVRIWDMATGQPVGEPLGDVCDYFAAACTRLDGRTVVVTGGDDGEIQVWDMATRRAIGEPIKAHNDRVLGIACAHVAGRAIAITIGVGWSVRFFDLAGQRPFGVPPALGFQDSMGSVACAEVHDRPMVVTCGSLHPIMVWDMLTGDLVRVLTGRRAVARVVACSVLDGRPVAVTGGDDGTVQLWDLATGRPVDRPWPGHVGPVSSVACTLLDGRPVAVTGGRDWTVRVWDLASGQPTGNPLTTRMGEVSSLACAEVNGRILAITGNPAEHASIWELGDRRSTGNPLIGHSAEVTALTSASVDGRRIVVSGGQDETVRVWDCATGQPVGDAMDSGGRVRDLALATLWGRQVAVAFTESAIVTPDTSASNALCAFDTAPHRRPIAGLPLLAGRIRALAFTTVHGRPAAVTVNLPQERLGVWDLTAGRLFRELRLENFDFDPPVVFVSCHLLGGRSVVVTAGGNEPLRVWDLTTGHAVGEPRTGQDVWVQAMASVTVTGHPLVVTAEGDGGEEMMRVWDLADDVLLRTIVVGPVETIGLIRRLACGLVDDRAVVATGGRDCVVRVWDLLDGSPLDEFVFPAPINTLSITEDGDILVGFSWEVAVLRRIHSGKAVP
jgi:WD40 repeat protein